MIKKQKIGLVGLGIMGLAMAKNISKKGFDVTVFNRSPQRLEEAKSKGLNTTYTLTKIIILRNQEF